MTSQSPSAIQNHKSLTEEETKSSSKIDSIAVDSEDCFGDSIYGSISEGRESILIQKIPHLETFQSHNLNFTISESPIEALYKAVTSNDIKTSKDILINSHPDTNIKFENNNTLLHIAANFGFLKICEILLDYGEDTNVKAQNNELSTPLHLACRHGHQHISQLLVRSGADLNKKNIQGNTALHMASMSENYHLVSWLLTRSPDVKLRNIQGKTAEECGSEEVQKAFLKHSKRTIVSAGPSFDNSSKVLSRSKTMNNYDKITPSKFLVMKKLGKGSFGEVFLVCKQDTNQLYAMKVLQKDKIISQKLIKYALTERNVLSYMKHPFIVTLNFAFQTIDKLFLILNYCPGGDLGSHLSIEKRFTEYRARIYLCEIILAIEELHKHNIIFRDLKPDNVVLDEDGHALLTDFGLSKEKVHDNYEAKSFCGSLAYLAPEVIRRQGHGKAVDWYLLGVLFYEMVAGKPPYFSMDKNELINNIQRGKLKMPSYLSSEARELIIDLLQRDPAKRLGAIRDADEVKEHRFFKGIDWNSVYRKELCPPKIQKIEVPKTGTPAEEIYGTFLAADSNRILGWTFVSDQVYP
ncbi:hypothetical protein SteCoe_32837 [Stentor coeruleus]|uniref:Protein kinase domain-containing protein n=1 Tax=Stentor coeruleus TaxID=5963 RepID=A0A1R2AY62_9CILI|nr:hypothetical protein SteCoe_32837 [Stentor coeruleus]